ncbi:MAG: 2,3-bisphosphoglycerate-independent phosphoglycerate mutase [Candidatus Methanoliparum thermophilum]|uniref:2,3-bisphosphoglycerate-independent phosphoglycerate mutase n=1 Tax=Methanoliparum thermophilum TaxID=2491083 RepID=A0A520KTE4_METT2|nr:MAG: 2,3-bisphosphoglycerate-independent phosphoglycerate mutase [Candidatus Methanoliparum thermophilum]
MKKKILFIVLDGAADRPVLIDGEKKTPFSDANLRNINQIARDGINGIMDVISPGIPPGSDVGHLSLLGYDPYRIYTGRGPLEAIGAGISVKKGDLAFRCNFATYKDGIILDRRAGRINDTDGLAEAIEQNVKLKVDFLFKRSAGHRAALVLRGDGLSYKITDVDPGSDNLPLKKAEPLDETAEKTAEILNDFVEQSIKILSNHPINEERKKRGLPIANVILPRGAGIVPVVEKFEEKYGLKGAAVAATGLVIGISRLCGLDFTYTEGATGSIDTNIDNKVKNALELLDTHDFVLMNIKGTDEAGHDRDFLKKKRFLERIDAAFERLVGLKDTIIVITSDHATPVSVGDHTGDPVPICISGEGVRADKVKRFNEFECANGGLGRIRGKDLMPILLRYQVID